MARQYSVPGGYVSETGIRSYATPFGYVVETSGTGSQSITGALFTNSNAFYGATVTTGSVTITGALFANASSFFGATVATTVGIAGSLFSSANTFFASTVTQAGGSQAITGTLYANDNTFFASAVSNASTRRSSGTGYAYKTLTQIRKEKQEEIARVQREAKKAVADVISAPGILSEDLNTIVRQEVEAAPQSWLTPELINLIVKRIEAQFRRAFIQKQQEDEADEEDVFILAA